MTPYELIKETIDFYTADPSRRAVRSYNCMYLDPHNGNKCAVGRCMEEGEWQNLYGSAEELFEMYPLDKCLKPEFQNIQLEVWKDLQHWHDHHLYWEDGRLSSRGQKEADQLLLKYQTQPS